MKTNPVADLLRELHEVFPTEGKRRHGITLNPDSGYLELNLNANGRAHCIIFDDEAELEEGAALIPKIQAVMNTPEYQAMLKQNPNETY